jgi:hypothetical protein
MFSE